MDQSRERTISYDLQEEMRGTETSQIIERRKVSTMLPTRNLGGLIWSWNPNSRAKRERCRFPGSLPSTPDAISCRRPRSVLRTKGPTPVSVADNVFVRIICIARHVYASDFPYARCMTERFRVHASASHELAPSSASRNPYPRVRGKYGQ